MLQYNKYIKKYIKPYDYPLKEIQSRKSIEDKIYVGTWNLDYTLALTLISYFKVFKANTTGFPVCKEIKSQEDWDKILDEIINDLEFYIEHGKGGSSKESKIAYRRIKHAFNLIGKWFFDFWW